MKTIYLLRHADAIKGSAELRDFDRPLSKRGEQQCRFMGELISKEKIRPDLIISSSAKRAKETAYLTAKAAKLKTEVVLSDELYEANIHHYVKIIKEMANGAESVMLVAHNPTEEEFLWKLVGEQSQLSKATLAVISLPISAWKELHSDISGKLVNIWSPQ